MIESSQLYFFILAALALLLVPGPAVLYITARSANQGRMAGLVSVFAIETANLIQAVAAALGLSAILLSSALAFDVVKYLGAAYLIYLGIRKLMTHLTQFLENARVFPHPSPLPKGEGTPVPFGGRVGDEGA